MNQPAKSHEPSMEEILASIRRIIADDDSKGGASLAAVEPPPPPPAAPVVAAVEARPQPPSPMDFINEIPPAPEPVSEPEAADILELTEEMRAPDPELSAPSFKTVDAHPDVVFAEDPPEPEPEYEMPEPELPAYDPLENARKTLSAQMQMDTDRPLLSRSASAAVDTAFGSLAHTVLSQNARTLDDLVKDMLRPMLKSWLDDNLPSLVERMVRAEIERVSRGR
jgi:cell pole-organizing protein PopZ